MGVKNSGKEERRASVHRAVSKSGSFSTKKNKKNKKKKKKKKHLKPEIVSYPNVCGGEPCIKGTRIPVHIILTHLAAGDDDEAILENFPKLRKEDIELCRKYAARRTARRESW